MGKELLKEGKADEALPWLKTAAEADNPYAEYLLGKLLWEGAAISQDKEQAVYWLGQAAEQGYSHAQLLLERQSGSSLPSAVLAVNGLLQQMGRIIQDNVKAMDSTHSHHTDHKLRRKIQEKKIAMGLSRTTMRNKAMLAPPSDLQDLRRSKQEETGVKIISHIFVVYRLSSAFPKMIQFLQPLQNFKDHRTHLCCGEYAVQTFYAVRAVCVREPFAFFWLAVLNPAPAIHVEKPTRSGQLQTVPASNQAVLQKLLSCHAEVV